MNECNVYLKFYTAIIEIQCWCLAYTVLKYFRFIVTACGKYIQPNYFKTAYTGL